MRILAGTAMLIAGLATYALLVMRLGAALDTAHWSAQAAFYAVAGIAWVPAAMRLTAWMQRRRV